MGMKANYKFISFMIGFSKEGSRYQKAAVARSGAENGASSAHTRFRFADHASNGPKVRATLLVLNQWRGVLSVGKVLGRFLLRATIEYSLHV